MSVLDVDKSVVDMELDMDALSIRGHRLSFQTEDWSLSLSTVDHMYLQL